MICSDTHDIYRALNCHALGVRLAHFDPFSQHLALYLRPKFSHSIINLTHFDFEKLRALYLLVCDTHDSCDTLDYDISV